MKSRNPENPEETKQIMPDENTAALVDKYKVAQHEHRRYVGRT